MESAWPEISVPVSIMTVIFFLLCLHYSGIDPCDGFECSSNARCRVHPPTGEAFCEESCSLNNGGCPFGQECSLVQPLCLPGSPCPLLVVCNHVGPCTVCQRDQACILEPIPCFIPPCPEIPRCLEPRCALKADPGPCEAAITRYFYDAGTRRCTEFTYGGCDGNENNFETLEECVETCNGEHTSFTGGGWSVYQWNVAAAITVSPCATILCLDGFRCEVENGVGFCQPDCSLNNGGCRPDQTCRLEQVQCVQPPCPLDRICEDNCPLQCSREFCDGALQRRLCSKLVKYTRYFSAVFSGYVCKLAFCHSTQMYHPSPTIQTGSVA